MYLSRVRCHCPVKAWNTSIYYQKLMELMPSQFSAFKLPGIDARSNSVKNETIHIYKYNITFIDKYFIGKKTNKVVQ